MTSQVKLLKVVLFPAPLTPNKAKHSPLVKEKVKLLTAIRGLAPKTQQPA